VSRDREIEKGFDVRRKCDEAELVRSLYDAGREKETEEFVVMSRRG
jgi:hypothetical protein